MVFDGHWKWEVQKLTWELSVWRKLFFPSEYAEHRLNRAILYSATILRKIIEDETEAVAILKKNGAKPPHPMLPHKLLVETKLPAIRYPYTGQEGWSLRSKLCPEDYGSGTKVELTVKDVCNWLLHSYVWNLAWDSDKKSYAGFFVASDFDREKYVHAIHFSDWQTVLKLCLDESAF